MEGERVTAGQAGHEVEGGDDAAVDDGDQQDDRLPSRPPQLEQALRPAQGAPSRRHSTW